MKTTKIQCWIKTRRRMKWRLAMRIASLPDEKWAVKAAQWNPELNTKYKTYRALEGPKRRWEDKIDEFLKPEETKTTTGCDMKNNDTWIKVAKKRERWTTWESEYAKTAEERSVDNVLRWEPTTGSNQTSTIPERGEIGRRRSGQHHIVQVMIEVPVTKLKRNINDGIKEAKVKKLKKGEKIANAAAASPGSGQWRNQEDPRSRFSWWIVGSRTSWWIIRGMQKSSWRSRMWLDTTPDADRMESGSSAILKSEKMDSRRRRSDWWAQELATLFLPFVQGFNVDVL